MKVICGDLYVNLLKIKLIFPANFRKNPIYLWLWHTYVHTFSYCLFIGMYDEPNAVSNIQVTIWSQ